MTLSAPSPPDKIKLVRIAHVYYTHKSFEKEHQFLLDFGLTETKRSNTGTSNEKIWYRGYGTEPFVHCLSKGDENGFDGAAFVVESRDELELAARIVSNASKIYELGDAPGGGECVTIKDPVDNFQLHLVWGQTQRELTEELHQRDYNFVSVAEVAIALGRQALTTRGHSQQRSIDLPTRRNKCTKVGIRPNQVSHPATLRLAIPQAQPKSTSSATSPYAYLISQHTCPSGQPTST